MYSCNSPLGHHVVLLQTAGYVTVKYYMLLCVAIHVLSKYDHIYFSVTETSLSFVNSDVGY